MFLNKNKHFQVQPFHISSFLNRNNFFLLFPILVNLDGVATSSSSDEASSSSTDESDESSDVSSGATSTSSSSQLATTPSSSSSTSSSPAMSERSLHLSESQNDEDDGHLAANSGNLLTICY